MSKTQKEQPAGRRPTMELEFRPVKRMPAWAIDELDCEEGVVVVALRADFLGSVANALFAHEVDDGRANKMITLAKILKRCGNVIYQRNAPLDRNMDLAPLIVDHNGTTIKDETDDEDDSESSDESSVLQTAGVD